jgi:FAD/FMN-containing dehydrogenase
MTFAPSAISELQEAIVAAGRNRQPLPPIDLSAFHRVLEHEPEDLTCTVECGCTLASLQASLATRGQWLPIDPPHPQRLPLRYVIDQNLSGPRRFGFGTLRDYLIGLEVILGDGSRVRTGARVVKNVAGYDLHKLFLGSHGSLGIPIIATFKLLPLPAETRVRAATCHSIEEAMHRMQHAREEIPGLIALDVCRSSGEPGTSVDVFMEFTGSDLERSSEKANAIGFTREATRGWDEELWHDPANPPPRMSVLPSELGKNLASLVGQRFVARAGNGVIYHDGSVVVSRRPGPVSVIRRLKAAFDPGNVLPPVPA